MADLSKCKNLNDVVYAIAERAKVLANQKIDELRRSVASQEAHTEHAMWSESRHKSRGDMVEEILLEEFIEETPRDIQEDE